MLNEKEMEAILEMYILVRSEGQETKAMVDLVERIKKEKEKRNEETKSLCRL